VTRSANLKRKKLSTHSLGSHLYERRWWIFVRIIVPNFIASREVTMMKTNYLAFKQSSLLFSFGKDILKDV
jgi:hypothetical protein